MKIRLAVIALKISIDDTDAKTVIETKGTNKRERECPARVAWNKLQCLK